MASVPAVLNWLVGGVLMLIALLGLFFGSDTNDLSVEQQKACYLIPKDHPDNEAVPGALVFRVEASLLYFNVEHVAEAVWRAIRAATTPLEVVVTLDCPDPCRVGGLLEGCRAPGTRVLNIDHHGDNRRYGDVNWIQRNTNGDSNGRGTKSAQLERD